MPPGLLATSPAWLRRINLYNVNMRLDLIIVKIKLAHRACSRYPSGMNTKEKAEAGGVAERPASYHHGDLRAALIRAAREMLESQGLESLSLRGVARRAGVSQTAPYHHFPDKAHLLAAVAAEGFAELAQAMRARCQAETEPDARLLAAGIGYVAFATGNPALFRLMFGGSGIDFADDPELCRAATGARDVLMTETEAVIAARGGSAAEARPVSLAAWSLVHGLATLILEAGVDPETYGAATAAALARLVLGRTSFA